VLLPPRATKKSTLLYDDEINFFARKSPQRTELPRRTDRRARLFRPMLQGNPAIGLAGLGRTRLRDGDSRGSLVEALPASS
jgi:hypothetical protein